LPLAMKFKLS